MEQISKNFKFSEFEYSATAKARGIENRLPATLKPNIEALVKNLLQPLIDYIMANGIAGIKPEDIAQVYDSISSGYRSPALNVAVKGALGSQHMKAEAADNNIKVKLTNGAIVAIQPYDVKEAVLASGLPYDQMIVYNGFVHLSYVSYRPNRGQLLYNSSYIGKR